MGQRLPALHHWGQERAAGIDLLRAFAIFSVMLYHLSSHGVALPALVEQGWMGVDLFFVLSGYLIGWQLFSCYAGGSTPGWGGFLLGRALRILPAYYVVLALYFLLPDQREGGTLQALWKFLTFTLNLYPQWEQGLAYSHAWSLCIEQHFYLLLPATVWLLARHANLSRISLLLALLWGGALLLRGYLWQTHVAASMAAGKVELAMQDFIVWIYHPTYARLDGLLLGVTLAMVRAFRPHWWVRLQSRSTALLWGAGAIFLLCLQIPLMSLTGAMLLYPLVALGCGALVLSVSSPASYLARQRVPGARTLATLAYSLYLTHRQIYHWLDTLLPELAKQSTVVAAAGYGTASLLAAAVLYLLVERPALGLRRRLLAAPQGQPQPDASRRSAA
ncbi:acyltransferase family protein [Pseudoduganella danionis]|uniref:Acyltransferase family protein n=1 Tax=Pseudoduganella danionis TaxID=1890295 RepID=A0ABW9SQS6_9BURK|nr:acyltransferase [Pseudoduganella danionis]MTW34441.1 acyltransferase family protein [Pseudoduganella danionis]